MKILASSNQKAIQKSKAWRLLYQKQENPAQKFQNRKKATAQLKNKKLQENKMKKSMKQPKDKLFKTMPSSHSPAPSKDADSKKIMKEKVKPSKKGY